MTAETENVVAGVVDDKIACAICGERVHSIQNHLKKEHPEIPLDQYKTDYPESPLLSPRAQKMYEEKVASSPHTALINVDGFSVTKKAMHDIFQLGAVKAAMSHLGTPIPISVIQAPPEMQIYVPDVDPNYVFDVGLLKDVLLAMQDDMKLLLWGHAGVGKTSVIEQVCARIGRPWMRIQHTRNMEESHVVGQWIVRDGQTVFELGPLAYAMKHGLVVVADEYDFAMPAVTALYQSVMEGKPLVIKDADLANRIIRPHPMFRFMATGNTNGSGDETGLYAGTMIMNAANYERFSMVVEVLYPEEKAEVARVAAQAMITVEAAMQLVKFGATTRQSFNAGKIGLPCSPRALINAGKIGKRKGSMRAGLMNSYINRLPRVDAQAMVELLDRMKI